MKRIIQVRFFTGVIMLFCFATGYCQLRPSQRSYTSIVNEINRERAARTKMIQHMKQTTPPNIVLLGAGVQSQSAFGGTVAPPATQRSLSSPATNQKPAIKQINPQLKAPIMRKH